MMNNRKDEGDSSSCCCRPFSTMIPSMLLLTVILVLMPDGCSGFTFPSTTKINPITITSIQRHTDQRSSFRKRRRRIHTTKIFAQKKKPRFSQQGSHIVRKTSEGAGARAGGSDNRNNNKRHINRNNNNKNERRQPNQVWKSGKSIDDLESTMSKRWGIIDDSSQLMSGGIPDGFEIFNDDENDSEEDGRHREKNTSKNEKIKTKGHNAHSSNRWARPVIDPWDEDEEKEASAQDSRHKEKNDQFTGVREYYDQDDEGYEIIGSVDDGNDNNDIMYDKNDDYSSSNAPRVDHLIAPQPAGGRGTNQKSDKKSTSSGSGYFFNPNAVASPPTTTNNRQGESSSISENDRKRDTARNNTSVLDDDRKSSRPRPSTPLLDERTGKSRLLTVEEALHRFQESIDEKTIEIIETADVPILAQKANAQSWDDLGILSTNLLENLEYEMKCPNPLAVQEKTTPAILTGNDVLVGTYTGSGKTLSFLVPLVQRLLWNYLDDDENDDDNDNDDDDDGIRKKNNIGLAVIIVAPGRELASQIVSVARDLLQNTGLTVQLAIGGTGFKRNLEQLRKRKPNIIVGTPGRIAELVVGKPGEKSGRLKVSSLQTLVLDEFDALLEYKPHRDPTQAIMQTLKRRHGNALQSVLCSATATDIMDSSKVVDFLRPGFETVMADEDDILVTGRATNDKSSSSTIAAQVSRTVIHGVVHVPHKRLALDAVRKILHTEPIPQQILIFVENARKVDIVVEKLADRGIIAAPLHGGMGSEKMDRAEVSRALREGYVGIVVATELAARGLDAPLLTHVVNLDLPTDASHYAHRSGRCGRGGRPGVVINITISNKERNVPKKFTETLGVELFTVEPKGGKLIIVDSATQTLDKSRSW